MRDGCGCDIALEAAKEKDYLTRRSLNEGAEIIRKLWNCPGTHCSAEPELSNSTETRERLAAVEELTGATGLKTCPHWYITRPAVHAVVEAYEWLEDGGLETRFGKNPPLALVQAVSLVRRSVQRREADDEKRREAERKRE